ncbi:MAG: ABC-2 family transporter protein [Candidatus Levyibacteriota bacterium]|nr:MAG: ABC-2 family transporter protein [Candidatus Levybacteria bacterium]
MRKYFLVITNTWNEILTYRLSFILWRLRTVLQLLTIYFLWSSLIPHQKTLFGYSQSLMLTYVIGTSFISSIVLSTRTHEIGENINSGNLSAFLARPIGYFGYWFARDMGDKLGNITFSLIELAFLFFLINPPLFFQTDVIYLLFFITTIFLGIILHFCIGSLLGMIGFWSPEVWAPRFIFFILIGFFAGSLFPLDIFPKPIFNLLQFMPFSYLLFFPLKIYLGQLSVPQIMQGISISLVWIIFLSGCLYFVWRKGLKMYTAYGN